MAQCVVELAVVVEVPRVGAVAQRQVVRGPGALRLTGVAQSGLAGVKPKAAPGGAFTVRERVVVADAPAASVTRRPTVRLPALENEW